MTYAGEGSKSSAARVDIISRKADFQRYWQDSPRTASASHPAVYLGILESAVGSADMLFVEEATIPQAYD
ncbi:hypothetical protein Y1Q_0003174 [Alligator mississippiensis]|uniref:Uncharacterized protein n=1 Tax=Alligator mississippiensis TaxID=8496 RepID=A0A151MDR3_ALLMI|nr:hypothetical protein Y1Q_0003174 [Alligator mississippiensis]